MNIYKNIKINTEKEEENSEQEGQETGGMEEVIQNKIERQEVNN